MRLYDQFLRKHFLKKIKSWQCITSQCGVHTGFFYTYGTPKIMFSMLKFRISSAGCWCKTAPLYFKMTKVFSFSMWYSSFLICFELSISYTICNLPMTAVFYCAIFHSRLLSFKQKSIRNFFYKFSHLRSENERSILHFR